MEKIDMTRVMHIITGLDVGGAETALTKLLSSSDRQKYHLEVISLTGDGYYGPRLRELGFTVHCLDTKISPISLIKTIVKVSRLVRGADTLCCWMYHANFVGLLAGRLAGIRNIIWNIRHSNLDKDKNKRSTLLLIKMCALMGKSASAIVYNSQQARKIHTEVGYPQSNAMVIPNGFDLSRFHPIPNARVTMRKELSVDDNVSMITTVSRWDPQKDVPNLLDAVCRLQLGSPVVLVLCGNGLTYENTDLQSAVSRFSLGDRIRLLGVRPDLPELLTASDLFVLPSAGESFPNALGEAMACGALCIATDVGDCAAILGDAGWIVPPQNSRALSEAIAEALHITEERRMDLIQRSITRIKDNYNLMYVTPRFEALYERK